MYLHHCEVEKIHTAAVVVKSRFHFWLIFVGDSKDDLCLTQTGFIGAIVKVIFYQKLKWNRDSIHSEYMAIGGMPEIVALWRDKRD